MMFMAWEVRFIYTFSLRKRTVLTFSPGNGPYIEYVNDTTVFPVTTPTQIPGRTGGGKSRI